MATFDPSLLKQALQSTRDAVPEATEYVDEALARLGAETPPPVAIDSAEDLARRIDHTQLKPQTTEADIRALCGEARIYCFASVCVSPCYVPLAVEEVEDAPVEVCTVIGFPSGATRSAVKAFEARQALEDGADELDMVLPVGLLKSGRYAEVEHDIHAVVDASGEAGAAVVKVILETALLTDAQKALACVLARRAGAGFVKTSTGFASGGATEADVALLRQMVGEALGVKASGGIRTAGDARRMIAAGATRLGASGSVAIMNSMKAPA